MSPTLSARERSPREPVPLAAQEIEAFREALLGFRDERERQVADLTASPIAPDDPVAVSHHDAVRRILAEIDAALDRLDRGTFGLCLHCSGPIPKARLELVPFTTGCVDCMRMSTGRR
jgi:DnaK suppressor protein